MIEGLGKRMIRAAQLDESLYEEVKADRNAPIQSAMVVILSAVAAGVAVTVHGGIGGFFLESLQAMVGWYLWAFFTCLVGTRVFAEPQTKTACGAMVRMIGFASAPGVVRLLGVIPGLSGFVFGLASAWMLGAMVIAVRAALDYTTTWRAAGVCVIGWVSQWLFMGILLSLRGPGPGA